MVMDKTAPNDNCKKRMTGSKRKQAVHGKPLNLAHSNLSTFNPTYPSHNISCSAPSAVRTHHSLPSSHTIMNRLLLLLLGLSGLALTTSGKNIDTGKINFIYREVYFDRFGLWASAISRCAGTPEAFFGITDMLYATQSEWARAGGGDPAMIADELRKIGRLAGLDGDTVEACLTDADSLRTLVAWYQENAAADGIQSTPSFVIDGRTYNNMAYPEMVRLIDRKSVV